MRLSLERVLVVDVESTCWEGPAPSGEEPEVIEIGLVELDVPTLERVARRSILVRPERSRVSPFCTRLTTLTAEDVEGGVPFAEACTTLRTAHDSAHRIWASFGEYDRTMIEDQCRRLRVAYPFGTRHLNVKALFALVYGLPREVGMRRALKIAGLDLEGTHHRGSDDAWNIAGLLAGLLGRARSEDGLTSNP
jgi:inhibitor of KinA sporulation pathway (predicted exonuclease)